MKDTTAELQGDAAKAKEMKPPRRPYWFVDAKWVAGLLLVAAAGAWLLTMALYRITGPATSVPITTNLLAYAFSRNGLDDTAGFAQLRAEITKSPTKSIQPIKGFPVTVTLHDIDTLSPRDLRLKIFGQIAQPLYDKGPAGYAAEITKDPAQQRTFENDSALLGLVTKDRHQALGRAAVILGAITLAVAAIAVFFSAGFGRLVTPAVVLLVTSVPGLALFSALRSWSALPAKTAAQSESFWTILDSTKHAMTPAFSSAQAVYLTGVKAAGLLLLAAGIGRVITSVVRARRGAQHPLYGKS